MKNEGGGFAEIDGSVLIFQISHFLTYDVFLRSG